MADNPNPFFADAPGQKKVNPETKKKTKKKAQTQQQEQQDVANKMTVGDKPKSYTAKAIKDALTEDSLVGNLEEDELFGDMSLTFDDTEGLFAVEETTEMDFNLALSTPLNYHGANSIS
mgnify:CR=1 FL=1